MRLGVVTTSYPRFAGDPAGSFVAAHVAALRALGHRVEIVAAGDPRDEPDVTRVPGGALFYTGGAPDHLERAPLAAARDIARFAPRFAAAVRARSRTWDGAIAHWLAPSAIAAILATRRELPLLAIAHGGDVHLLRRVRLLAPVLRALDRRGARVVYVSHALRALGDAAHAVRGARVQPMGIDVAHFATLARAPTTPPTIAVLARLVPIKGVDVAIDAFARLAIPARLVIAGAGPERTALELRARRLGVAVELVGELDAGARDALLARASVVVIPSRALATGRTEGTPVVALEALAAGIPVVASATGGLAELPMIHQVTPEDPTALATAIVRALTSVRLTHPPDLAEYTWNLIAPHLVPIDTLRSRTA